MAKSALILIDIQKDYFPGGKWELHQIEQTAANAARILGQARTADQMIVHVHHEFQIENPPFFEAGTPGAEFHPSVQPQEGEHKVLKHYVNAFRDTNLQSLLEQNGVTDVTIVGDMSHMCIDAAARNAADIGLNVTVVEDACSSRDLEFNGDVIAAEQVHKAYMSALSFAYAKVVTTTDYLASV
ncbi:cysteine hydrolase family protein [Ruegeria halocynthiae]|uniref:cysteine hydrolase family protein n=1 Tax=Ruegeria halocynthiae TaxID=985054 RepID=UPI00056276C5|nr:cysteine hydrolase family protein [Ruegeria halocynthiae]